MNICLYGASSPALDRAYFDAAEEFGRLLAKNGHTLVYGGGAQGVMGAAARGAADAFVMAPGGFGTLEEFFEVLTLKQLGRHNPAIAILNTNGFYDKLQEFVLSAVEQRFIRSACLNIYALCPTPADTLTYLEQYDPAVLDVRHLKNI